MLGFVVYLVNVIQLIWIKWDIVEWYGTVPINHEMFLQLEMRASVSEKNGGIKGNQSGIYTLEWVFFFGSWSKKTFDRSAIIYIYQSLIFLIYSTYNQVCSLRGSKIISSFLAFIIPIDTLQSCLTLIEKLVKPCQLLQVLCVIECFKKHRKTLCLVCLENL